MPISNYQAPVSNLLNYGDLRPQKTWPNYVEELKLENQHIPQLIEMVMDSEFDQMDSDSKAVWGPVHAWRALAQLQAEAAIEPLLTFLNEQDDDWISSEFPEICCLIGVKTIPFITNFLADSSKDMYARCDVIESLKAIALKYPETRSICVEAIIQVLENFSKNDPILNGFLINYLAELQATEAISIIEQAYLAKKVDTFAAGTWDDVQAEFGLKAPTPRSISRESKRKSFELLFNSNAKTEKVKGFGDSQSLKKKKSSKKSSGKRKKK